MYGGRSGLLFSLYIKHHRFQFDRSRRYLLAGRLLKNKKLR